MKELALVEQRLQELGRTIEDIPLNQLHAELAAIESAILEILVEDVGTVSTAGGVAEDSNTGEAPGPSGGGPAGSETSAATAETAVTPSAEPSEEPTPSDEPSSEPGEDPTPAEEPTPEPAPTG